MLKLIQLIQDGAGVPPEKKEVLLHPAAIIKVEPYKPYGFDGEAVKLYTDEVGTLVCAGSVSEIGAAIDEPSALQLAVECSDALGELACRVGTLEARMPLPAIGLG